MGANIWFPRLAGEAIIVLVDNQNVEAWANALWAATESPIVANLIRMWWALVERHGIDVLVRYVGTKENDVPDALSRNQWTRFALLTHGRDMTLCAPTCAFDEQALLMF